MPLWSQYRAIILGGSLLGVALTLIVIALALQPAKLGKEGRDGC